MGLRRRLFLAGRHSDARALAGFIADCIVLFRRLLADDRTPRSRKALIFVLIAYSRHASQPVKLGRGRARPTVVRARSINTTTCSSV
jgi:hypothetical protein